MQSDEFVLMKISFISKFMLEFAMKFRNSSKLFNIVGLIRGYFRQLLAAQRLRGCRRRPSTDIPQVPASFGQFPEIMLLEISSKFDKDVRHFLGKSTVFPTNARGAKVLQFKDGGGRKISDGLRRRGLVLWQIQSDYNRIMFVTCRKCLPISSKFPARRQHKGCVPSGLESPIGVGHRCGGL